MIAANIELLISEGHSFTEIRKYSFPQLMLFVRLIYDRWERNLEAMKEAQKKSSSGDDGDGEPIVRTSYLGKRPRKQKK